MSSDQIIEKTKERLTLEAENIPVNELEDLLSETNGFWAKSETGDLWHIPIKLLSNEKVCPVTIFNIKEKLSTIENRESKKISFTLKHNNDNYIIGINEYDKYGKLMSEDKQSIWRVKQDPNQASSSSYSGGSKGGFAPQPLAELFIGTIEECNQKLRDESKKWYLAEQKIFLNETDGYKSPLGYAILKRNRFVGAPPPPPTNQTPSPSTSS